MNKLAEKTMPMSRLRNPASPVARFQNMPKRMTASSGAMKMLNRACT